MAALIHRYRRFLILAAVATAAGIGFAAFRFWAFQGDGGGCLRYGVPYDGPLYLPPEQTHPPEAYAPAQCLVWRSPDAGDVGYALLVLLVVYFVLAGLVITGRALADR